MMKVCILFVVDGVERARGFELGREWVPLPSPLMSPCLCSKR